MKLHGRLLARLLMPLPVMLVMFYPTDAGVRLFYVSLPARTPVSSSAEVTSVADTCTIV